jgi:arginase
MQTVAVIGAPLDLGAGRRGVDMGPSAIRYAGLEARLREIGYDVDDHGNVFAAIPEAADEGDERARFLPQILESTGRIAELVRTARKADQLPLVLGGDHSVALGTLAGMASVDGAGGLIWLDAHGDLNRPATSPSGNVHGMVLAAALGLAGPQFRQDGWPQPAVDPARTVLVGVRSLDQGERELVKANGICILTMSDIDERGIKAVMDDALERVAGPGFVHVSLDMDVLDPRFAPGVGTPIPGGLDYREAHFALELVATAGVLTSLDVVEVNTILDHENETAATAVELVGSALGSRIL